MISGVTRRQRELLERLLDGPVRVSGPELAVARALERRGIVQLGIGGSGVAYRAPWWWEARLVVSRTDVV